MSQVMDALIPVVCLLALGSFLQYRNFVRASFWQDLEKICYFILTPVFLIHGFASKRLGDLPWQKIALSVYVPLLLAAALIWGVWYVYSRIPPQKFTSMFQAGVRFNAFIALALANGLYGAEGMLVCSLVVGFMVVMINFLCVTTFSLSLRREAGVLKTVVLQLARNPLILGCIIGVSINLSGVSVPAAALNSLEILGRACLPVALIIVGAAIDLSSVLKDLRTSVAVGIVQFLVKPAAAILSCAVFGLEGVTAAVVILCLAVPTAPSGYILARQLGGDYQVMASMIAQQTLFALLSMPLTIWLVGEYLSL